MSRKVYKYCFVPCCTSTTVKTPDKRFIAVPIDLTTRKKWFIVSRRNDNQINTRTSYYCCEDHFNMEEDFSNLLRHKVTGCRLIVKDSVLPSRFDCQTDLVRARTTKNRPVPTKRKQKNLVEVALKGNYNSRNDAESDSSVSSESFENKEKRFDIKQESAVEEREMDEDEEVVWKPESIIIKEEPISYDNVVPVNSIGDITIKEEPILEDELPRPVGIMLEEETFSDGEDARSCALPSTSKAIDHPLSVSSQQQDTAATDEGMPFRRCTFCADKIEDVHLVTHLRQCLKWKSGLQELISSYESALENVRKTTEPDECPNSLEMNLPRELSSVEPQKKLAKKYLECEFCGKCCKTYQSFVLHVLTHEGRFGYMCSLCGHKFVNVLFREEHIWTHGDILQNSCGTTLLKCSPEQFFKDFKCEVCVTEFPSKADLEYHIITFHVALEAARKRQTLKDDKIYWCQECGKSFLSQTALTNHMLIHVENLQCDKCDKKFSSKKNVRAHVLKEHMKNNFKCEKCDKTFLDEDSLVRHLKWKHKEKNFKCSSCGAKFNQKRSLKKHVCVDVDNTKLE